jgi:Zn-dependent oligopeptidase
MAAIARASVSLAGVTEPDFGVDLGPELEAAMAEHRAEVGTIAAGPWPPSFADTIAALEASGDRLATVRAITRREPSVEPLLRRRGRLGPA